MRLFIDDERPAPEGWIWAKTSSKALLYLNVWRDYGSKFEAISFDHDLSEEDTTRRVLLWMCEHNYWPNEAYVHTGNPVGEEFLVGMIRRYAPEGTLKGYGLNYWGTSNESVIRNEYLGEDES